MSKYYFSAFIFFFIFGCAGRISPQKTGEKTPGYMENLRVKENQSIEIALDEASTAGYVWHYEVSEDGVISMTESYDDPMKSPADTTPPPVGGFSKKNIQNQWIKARKSENPILSGPTLGTERSARRRKIFHRKGGGIGGVDERPTE